LLGFRRAKQFWRGEKDNAELCCIVKFDRQTHSAPFLKQKRKREVVYLLRFLSTKAAAITAMMTTTAAIAMYIVDEDSPVDAGA
jgi:hypothetical protein